MLFSSVGLRKNLSGEGNDEPVDESPDFLDQLASKLANNRKLAQEMLGKCLAEGQRTREKLRTIAAKVARK